jgi:hypothetical protein
MSHDLLPEEQLVILRARLDRLLEELVTTHKSIREIERERLRTLTQVREI